MGLPLSVNRALQGACRLAVAAVSLRGVVAVSLRGVAGLSLACAAVPPPEGRVGVSGATDAPATEVPSEEGRNPAAASPKRSQLFFAWTLEGELWLKAFSAGGVVPFEQRLARDVQHVLHNPELELIWYSDAERLWVIDTRSHDVADWQPVLIASHLPQGDRLHVERGGSHYVAPGRISDETLELVLHWDAEPWIEAGGDASRLDGLDGRAWLERERARPPRPAAALQFAPADKRSPLPADWAGCRQPGICGAALPFGPRGWELVVTNEDLGGDFLEHECRLHDPATALFSAPLDGQKWAAPDGVAAGPCGPYLFNSEKNAFLVEDVVCSVGGTCTTLDGRGRGWLEPGGAVGNE